MNAFFPPLAGMKIFFVYRNNCKKWSPRNWNFPRNLHAGRKKRLKLVPARGGPCLSVLFTSREPNMLDGKG